MKNTPYIDIFGFINRVYIEGISSFFSFPLINSFRYTYNKKMSTRLNLINNIVFKYTIFYPPDLSHIHFAWLWTLAPIAIQFVDLCHIIRSQLKIKYIKILFDS